MKILRTSHSQILCLSLGDHRPQSLCVSHFSLDVVFRIPLLLNPELVRFFFLSDEWLPSFLHSQVPFL